MQSRVDLVEQVVGCSGESRRDLIFIFEIVSREKKIADVASQKN